MRVRSRSGAAAALVSLGLVLGVVAPATATIHEKVASFCSGGHGNVFPHGQSKFGEKNFLQALRSSGVITVRADTPTAGAITLDYNNDAPAGKFVGSDIFVEAIPGVWIEVLDPNHPAFEHCTHFTFE